MEIVEQINQICLETNNEWFLNHQFTKIALYDLKLKEELEKDKIISSEFNFDERECVCFQGKECIMCLIEMERDNHFDKLQLSKCSNAIYDYKNNIYTKSKWIIAEPINGEIPGFILIKCSGDGLYNEDFTHELVFACVRPRYRKNGILKNMVNKIPKEWNIWLEANSNDIENIKHIWEKCGFIYNTTIHGKYQIYKKCIF